MMILIRRRRRRRLSGSGSTRRGSRDLGARDSGVCGKNTPPDEETGWTVSSEITKSRAGFQFLLLDCKAKAHVKEVFFFTDRLHARTRRGERPWETAAESLGESPSGSDIYIYIYIYVYIYIYMMLIIIIYIYIYIYTYAYTYTYV